MKIQRHNLIKRILSHTSEESALSITEITEKLAQTGQVIHRKTIERDITELSVLYPLCEIGSNPKKYFFEGDFKFSYEMVFNEDQLQTMVIALEYLKQVAPKFMKESCEEAETTLVHALPKGLAREFEHIKGLSTSSPTVIGESFDLSHEVFQTVINCLRKGKVFECEYRGLKGSKKKGLRKFAPLKLHFVGSPYLYVYDLEDLQIKLIKLARIVNPRKTEINVDKKRAKDIKLDYVFGAYGRGDEKVVHYEIHCGLEMAQRFQEHRIHPSQEIFILGENEFKIKFSVHDSKEIIRLIAQYGECIYQITPHEAYDQVKEIWSSGLKFAKDKI